MAHRMAKWCNLGLIVAPVYAADAVEIIERYSGALEGTRTPNLLIRSQMLYPLSYERLWLFILGRALRLQKSQSS